MGVQGLWKLLESSGRPIDPETLEGKILAVDISIWLNQAIKGARDRHGNAIQNAHLLVLFHRLCKLLFFRIRPIFVFDGDAPLLKRQTLASRRQRKAEAADESKKTTERIFKTFLKRQAIKAALGSRSNEVMPSLSQVRRDEVDIYDLPPLEEKDANSSEEESEREWEEKMKQKQLFQEEFFDNPNSVDIDSEEFSALPPEMKHEILTDMKEFSKRRRTLFEAMPEESTDFSSYQLSGLLKRNTLNQRICDVEKEMNHQHSGQIEKQYCSEGGFVKEFETRRLVSEDTSHYILIKGVQSQKGHEESEKEASESVVLFSKQEVCSHDPLSDKDTHSELTLPVDSRTANVNLASPRTLSTIEATVLESSSDDECEKLIPCQEAQDSSHSNDEGNMSPRTLQAIQYSLTDDGDTGAVIAEGNMTQYRSYVSSEVEGSVSPRTLYAIQQALEDDEKEVTQHGIISLQETLITVSSSDKEDRITENNKNMTDSFSSSHCIPRFPNTGTISPVNVCGKPENTGTEKTEKAADHQHSTFTISCILKDTYKTAEPSCAVSDIVSVSSVSSSQPVKSTALMPFSCKMENAASSSHLPLQRYVSDTVCEGENGLANGDIAEKIPQEKNPGEMAQGMALSRVQLPTIQTTTDESDSEGSFIEVVTDTQMEDTDNFFQPKRFEMGQSNSETRVPMSSRESDSEGVSDSGGEEKGDSVLDCAEEVEVAIQQKVAEQEPAVNDWDDIDLEGLEAMENNLFVQQSNLQHQKQQQERIAATVTGQMYLECQELLRLFGIPYIVAPMEAEAQCAFLDLTDQTAGTITDDSDIWLFGARHVYKNFFSQNKYVEYYQFVDFHNQLGLDRRKLINLAYLLGSDYTEGIPGVGFVTAMEILNEFPGHGMEPLLKLKEWWTEAQKNKRIRPNPYDTKVKKKLRGVQLPPGFPNPAVVEAYLKPEIDDSEESFSWGRPDLQEIREFCENRFRWRKTKTDEVLLPVMKRLNTHQTQLRIDSFFRVEQHEKQAIKSQRLRRAVICMRRKEKEGEHHKVKETNDALEERLKTPVKDKKNKSTQCNTKGQTESYSLGIKRKRPSGKNHNVVEDAGGFVGSINALNQSVASSEDDSEDGVITTRVKEKSCEKYIPIKVDVKRTEEKDRNNRDTLEDISSSEEDSEEENKVMVTAKPVFENKTSDTKKSRGSRTKKQKRP
ncbi:DNA excision repair protein ERCC-5-like [Protopterus annectens]|uniref:DNA excision repair protein ERCC-5-like n=1 Tax=Protopterus annectens TaxID=7888 RepID=UPI001CFA69FC|nr:DNA excision repair protein ERCC-5-like [Protopterus annectens]